MKQNKIYIEVQQMRIFFTIQSVKIRYKKESHIRRKTLNQYYCTSLYGYFKCQVLVHLFFVIYSKKWLISK